MMLESRRIQFDIQTYGDKYCCEHYPDKMCYFYSVDMMGRCYCEFFGRLAHEDDDPKKRSLRAEKCVEQEVSE